MTTSIKSIFEKEKNFNKQYQQRISELLDICKRSQGERVPWNHGPGSFATTYSNEFLHATAELYALYDSCEIFDPVHEVADQFRKNDIRSCRGQAFGKDIVEYIYRKHLREILKRCN